MRSTPCCCNVCCSPWAVPPVKTLSHACNGPHNSTPGCLPPPLPRAPALPQAKAQVAPGTQLVCTCAHGRRGLDAAKQLAAAGYEQVVNLEGGLAKWADLDLPHTGQIKRHH